MVNQKQQSYGDLINPHSLYTQSRRNLVNSTILCYRSVFSKNKENELNIKKNQLPVKYGNLWDVVTLVAQQLFQGCSK